MKVIIFEKEDYLRTIGSKISKMIEEGELKEVISLTYSSTSSNRGMEIHSAILIYK